VPTLGVKRATISKMSRRPTYEYAQLPVFKYQTFDRATLSLIDHPIIPPERPRFKFMNHHADDQPQPTGEEAATEINDIPIPAADSAADEDSAEAALGGMWQSKDVAYMLTNTSTSCWC